MGMTSATHSQPPPQSGEAARNCRSSRSRSPRHRQERATGTLRAVASECRRSAPATRAALPGVPTTARQVGGDQAGEQAPRRLWRWRGRMRTMRVRAVQRHRHALRPALPCAPVLLASTAPRMRCSLDSRRASSRATQCTGGSAAVGDHCDEDAPASPLPVDSGGGTMRCYVGRYTPSERRIFLYLHL